MSCLPGFSSPFLRAASDFVASLAQALVAPGSESANDPLMERARQFVWQIERSYQQASGGHFAEDLLLEIRRLAPDANQLRDVVILWINLVEEVVQEAERSYGSKPNQGSRKAAQVKAVLIDLLVEQKVIQLPPVAEIFAPVIIEAAVGWSIDSVVMLLNRNECWTAAPEIGPAGRIRLAWPARGVMAFADWLLTFAPIQAIARWLAEISRRAVVRAHPLSPAARKALDAIEKNQLPQMKAVIASGVEIATFIGEHRTQVVALVQVIAAACHEAEWFLSDRPGAEKKAYARDIIVALLEDTGFMSPDAQLSNAVTEWCIDFGIDAIVQVFTKNGVYPKASSAG